MQSFIELAGMNPEIFRRVPKDHPLLDLDSKKSLDQIGLRVNPQDLITEAPDKFRWQSDVIARRSLRIKLLTHNLYLLEIMSD